GDFKQAETLVDALSPANNNYSLSLLEKGRLHFLANDWQASQKAFNLASIKIAEDNAKAKIRLSRGLANATAMVSNDNVIAYDVPAYEQSMLHTYQALNYVYLGSLEKALVEIRRANLVQEQALEENAKQLQDAENDFNQKALKQAYPSMDAMIGKLKNGFQNAYTFYLSGILYEAAGQPNDAYIDYKRALQIYPDNQFLQQDVLRLATSLDMLDDLARFTGKYGPYTKPDNTAQSGEVVILLEQGIVNYKDELRVDLPIFTRRADMRFFSFSLPIYQGGLTNHKPLTAKVADNSYQSQEIVRLQSLATKQLQEQLPALVTRQALRVVAKEQLRSSMSKEGGDVGNILAGLYNLASEHADTRSWLSLPDGVQILRLSLPAGQHALTLNVGNKLLELDLEVRAKRITMINVTSIGSYQAYKTSNL
ncbi:COG3014 family protein, partial [Paraglaciecola hydrolytica]|uniref:COG3014 family protein n=1 Tax=Paraglaciecola hydrolytica TaxID=1799789 RepID=UPI000838E973